MKKLLLYWHTLKYLKPVQIYGRIWFRLHKPRINHDLSLVAAQASTELQPGVEKSRTLFDDNTFRCLGKVMHLKNASDWNNPEQEKLLLYNLHYFDDLNATDAGLRSEIHHNLINRWISENPGSSGNGWEPYPVSLRIVNWIKFLARVQSPSTTWINSLSSQADFLTRRLENHLLGNHLFANAKALVFAGCYLRGKQADSMLNLGLKILERELPEQVLTDGGHFELSPMYHSIFIEDMLDLINIACAYPDRIDAGLKHQFEQIVVASLNWLQMMLHPDEEICFFNDAAFGIAPEYAALTDYAARLGIATPAKPDSPWWARESGFVNIQSPACYCTLDIGDVGPDYIPGHAHADTLSFELSLHKQRVFVNSGTSVYGNSAERLRQRGTASHNTVVLNDQNSSEVWGGFRVARRARVDNIKLLDKRPGNDEIEVSATHNGYCRWSPGVRHHRRWLFSGNELTISDNLSIPVSNAVAHFHLHPAVNATITDSGVNLLLKENLMVRMDVSGGEVSVEPSTWHPRFGATEPSTKIVVRFLQDHIETILRW